VIGRMELFRVRSRRYEARGGEKRPQLPVPEKNRGRPRSIQSAGFTPEIAGRCVRRGTYGSERYAQPAPLPPGRAQGQGGALPHHQPQYRGARAHPSATCAVRFSAVCGRGHRRNGHSRAPHSVPLCRQAGVASTPRKSRRKESDCDSGAPCSTLSSKLALRVFLNRTLAASCPLGANKFRASGRQWDRRRIAHRKSARCFQGLKRHRRAGPRRFQGVRAGKLPAPPRPTRGSPNSSSPPTTDNSGSPVSSPSIGDPRVPCPPGVLAPGEEMVRRKTFPIDVANHFSFTRRDQSRHHPGFFFAVEIVRKKNRGALQQRYAHFVRQ